MRLCFSNVGGSVNNSVLTNAVTAVIIARPSQRPIREALFVEDLIKTHSLPFPCMCLRCPAHVRLHCSSHEAKEGEPRCWSVFTASVERKGGRARADDLEGVQRQGPYLGEVPRGDSATAYLFLHFYFFFILFHSTAFISLSCQFRRTSTPILCPTEARHCIFCWHARSKGGNAPFFSFTATRLDYKS